MGPCGDVPGSRNDGHDSALCSQSLTRREGGSGRRQEVDGSGKSIHTRQARSEQSVDTLHHWPHRCLLPADTAHETGTGYAGDCLVEGTPIGGEAIDAGLGPVSSLCMIIRSRKVHDASLIQRVYNLTQW